MIEYHLLLARKHGEVAAYPVLSGFTSDTSAITRKYEELTGPAVQDFAKEHSEILFVSNGVVMANHDFPDPSAVEAARQRRVLAEALKIQADADAAKAALDAAKQRASEAAANVKQLSPEQRQLLADANAAKAKADADAKALADAQAKAQADADAAAAARAAETKAAADRAAARDTFLAELSALSDEELRAQIASNKIELPDDAQRADALQALAKFAGFAD